MCSTGSEARWVCEDERSVAEAKTVCARCPWSNPALAYAVEVPLPLGIWGGLTYNERNRIYRRAHRRAVYR